MSKYALLAIGVAAVFGCYLFTTVQSDGTGFAAQSGSSTKTVNELVSKSGRELELPQPANANQKDANSCAQFVAQPEEFNQLSMQYRHDVRTLRQELGKQLSPAQQHQWLAQVGLASLWLTSEVVPPPLGNKPRIELDAAQIQLLLGLLRNKKYTELAAKGRSNELPLSASLNGQTLLSSIIDLQPTITLEALNTVLSAGFEVDLATLYVATRAGITSDHLSSLLQYTQVDVSSTWHDEGQTFSLASAAASMGMGELTQFWYELGSPIFDHSQQLVSSNMVPWQTLSEDSALVFMALFNTASVGDILLTPADYQYLQTLVGAESLSAAPFIKQGSQNSIVKLDDELQALISQLLATESRIALYGQCDSAYQDKLDTLVAMLRGSEAMKRRGLHSLYKNIELLAGEPELYKKMDAALVHQQWEEALKWLLQLPVTPEHAAQFEYAYLTMILDLAPFNVLEQLVNYVKDIPPSFLFGAAAAGNNRVIHLLHQQGVDLHATNPHGENALHLAILSTTGTENYSVEYLLNLGLLPSEGKEDALMVLIKSASRLNEGIVTRYIDMLLHHGASVKPTHINEIHTNTRLSEEKKSLLLSKVTL